MLFAKIDIEQSIPQRFAEQVRRHGDRPAVVTEQGRVTYDELDRLSDRVAHALAAHRHLPGETVGVLFEQGIAQIASILGVLKHGGIYVPLDTALTRQRLREILADADPGIILTDRINASLARLIGGEHRLVLDPATDTAPQPGQPPVRSLAPDAYAYIYYTSGSTGTAKGVVDDHRNVLHNIARYSNSLKVTCEDRLTLLQSCGFSGAVSNIFTALLNGATLLPFDVRARGAVALANWLADQKPTIYHSVPSLFRHLMSCGVPLPSLRVIRLEGDLARGIDVEVFNRHFDSRCVLVNGLGATETGISAQYFIEHGTTVPGPVVPVGHSTADMRIDVVDTQGQPVPVGELGEVVVTSRYLARGYWRRPDLTDAAFRTIDGKARMYRTRDLGCIDARGRLQCHGRVDLLTKVRGEWVDLSVLERMLATCAGVKDAIATVVEDAASSPRLTAYVVADDGATVSSDRLRDALRAHSLPQHAMPSQFVMLERWPLDLNGKVDRKALAAMTGSARAGVAPRTPTEQLVADVFCRALDIAAVGLTDDFFELGGDSLKAVEVSLELVRLTGSELALGAFQHATSVEALARIIDGAIGPGSLVPLQPRGSQRPFFCVHAHMGHVFNLRELARQFAPERPFYGLQAKGLDGAELPETDLEAMAAAYVASVREMQPHGPYLLGGYCFGGWVAIEMARQLRSSGESVEALLLIATNLLPRMLPTLRGEGVVHQYASWWARARRKTLRSALSSIRYRLIHSAQHLRTSLLSHASRWGLTRRWPLKHALREPASAIAVMLHGCRPDPYAGGAVVLVPDNMPLDEATRQAWQDCVRGPIEFVSLAGDSKDLLRQPYVRDVAACIMARSQ